MYEFRMPTLGADMDAGTLVEWKVGPGDAVRRGDVVAVVETQKGAIDVEIWQGGTIERLVVSPGTKVPVGEVLALLRAEGEAVAPAAAPAAPAVAPAAAGRVLISPAARKRAAELGVDLATVKPGEPGAAISIEDVERARAAAQPAPPAATVATAPEDWHRRMREAIAAAMTRSKREVPHYYLSTDIDVTPLTAWLAAENLKRAPAERLLSAVPFMKAVALALREVPELNGVWADGVFRPSPSVHLGMAIALRGGGLAAPAIHDADTKSLDALMASLRDLVTRVRSGRLRSSEMSDPTITLTSLGELGVQQVIGVIYPPQSAIVGLGRISERPWAENGVVTARQVVTATLSADHRVSDGHRGALFLGSLARVLQDPEKLR